MLELLLSEFQKQVDSWDLAQRLVEVQLERGSAEEALATVARVAEVLKPWQVATLRSKIADSRSDYDGLREQATLIEQEMEVEESSRARYAFHASLSYAMEGRREDALRALEAFVVRYASSSDVIVMGLVDGARAHIRSLKDAK